MKIVPIFASNNPALFSAHYNEYPDDEFLRVFDEWEDIAYLEQFFEDNIKDLQIGFFGEISVEDAVILTMKHADELRNRILDCEKTVLPAPLSLDELFKPLINGDSSSEFVESKAKGNEHKSWLRIYALRITENFYIVSGGAIKLTRTMQERDHTVKELQKLRQVSDYLQEQGIIDEEGFQEYFI